VARDPRPRTRALVAAQRASSLDVLGRSLGGAGEGARNGTATRVKWMGSQRRRRLTGKADGGRAATLRRERGGRDDSRARPTSSQWRRRLAGEADGGRTQRRYGTGEADWLAAVPATRGRARKRGRRAQSMP
jgi:hypothetical protein